MTLLCHFFFNTKMQVNTCVGGEKMSCYFIVQVFCSDEQKRKGYDEYIQAVKPIVESYKGEYLVRTENVISLSHEWKPERVIVIRFPHRKLCDECFHSPEYLKISHKRELNVESHAMIVGGIENENM